MSGLTLADWLQRLEQLHPEEIELGLERVGRVARRLGVLQFACPVVTVAGTNGKGSTVASLQAILQDAGWRVGVYTSPHLLIFNERICIDGEQVTDAELVSSFERVDAARADVALTYFEFTTLAALDIFSAARLDAIILEVGLGGRLDAVNTVDPDIAVVTSIALDHQAWLGRDRERIAVEKAGILRPGKPFVCADLSPPERLRRRAQELRCDSHYITAERASKLGRALPLRGENIAAAQRVAGILGVDIADDLLYRLALEINLPGRLQRIELGTLTCIVDVAHNCAAVENLARFLRTDACSGRTIALFAALSDKNIRAMIRSIRDQVDSWFVTDLPHTARAASAARLSRLLRAEAAGTVSASDDPRQAYRRARRVVRGGDRIVVFGSFYTVAAVLPSIEKDRKRLE